MGSQDAYEYGHQNVAHVITATRNAFDTGHQNVAHVITATRNAYDTGHQNVAPPAAGPYGAYEYGHYGDVNTATPTPYIWILAPNAARPSDGIEILGHGFGATQAAFGGVVEANQSGAWVGVSVSSWTRIAASADAYTADRVITPDEIDPEHEVIAVTVPSWAAPPSVEFRVKTNGP